MGKSFLLGLESGKKSLADRQLGILPEELYSDLDYTVSAIAAEELYLDLHYTVSAIAAEVYWILNNSVDVASLSDSAADYELELA